MKSNNFMGFKFIWWIGIVEDRNDPLFLGRCRIRIFGWHTEDKTLIPTSALPWAQPIYPSNSTTTTNTPKEGDMVLGFFTDGEDAQYPVYFGTFPGIPTITPDQSKGFVDPRNSDGLDAAPVKPINRTINGTSGVVMEFEDKTPYPRVKEEPNTGRLSRNEILTGTLIPFRKDNIIQADSVGGSTWKEPDTGYTTVYPYSNTNESESGHVIQIDDTPNNERLMFAHRTGTTIEMYNSGTKLEKIVKDNYTIVHGSDFCYVKGKVQLTVDNVANIRIKGKTTIEIDGDVDWKIGGGMNLSIGKDLNVKTGGSVNWDVAGDYQQVIDGSFKSETGDVFSNLSGGNVSLDGSNINLNSGVSSSVTPTGIAKPNPYNNPDVVIPVPEQIEPVTHLAAIQAKQDQLMINLDTLDDANVTSTLQTQVDQGNLPPSVLNTPSKPLNVDNKPAANTAAQVGDCSGIDMTQTVFPDSYPLGSQWTLADALRKVVYSNHNIQPNKGLTSAQIVCNLRKLMINCWTPIKNHFPNAFITCTFREGSDQAQHGEGCAMDIQFKGFGKADYFNIIAPWIRDNVPFDQLLLEWKNTGTGMPWIHISFTQNSFNSVKSNRGQIITLFNDRTYPQPGARGLYDLSNQ